MKKNIILSVLCLALGWNLWATGDGLVNVRNAQVKKIGEQVFVSFEMEHRRFPSNQKVTIIPVMYDGNGKILQINPVTVVGRKRNKYDKRTGTATGDRRIVRKKNPYSMRYLASVPFQQWMQFVSLAVEQIEEGCCTVSTQELEEILEARLLYYEVNPYFNTTPFDYELTELEKYDLENPFLHPMEDYGERYNILLKDRDKGTSKVIFKVGSAVIDTEFHGNGNILDAIGKAFDLINNDPNAILKHIVIAGYASPEGSLTLNTKLGLARAEAVKEFIKGRMDVPSEHYFETINGREDWDGLREQVDKCNMPWRSEVLEIIDSYTMEQEIRKTKLKQLQDGVPYRYMLDNFYPPLRSGGYVQVYYEIDRKATVATAVTDEHGRTTWVDPDSPRNRGVTAINKAIKEMVDLNFDAALDLMLEFSDDPRSWNFIGVCYMMKGDYTNADNYFIKARDNGDEDAEKNLEQTGWARRVER